MQNTIFVHIINRNKIYTLYTTMKKNILTLLLLFTLFGVPFQSTAQTNYNLSQMKREKLGRGVVAVRKNSENVFVCWRYLSSDLIGSTFNIYRNGAKINKAPIANKTCYVDTIASTSSCTYTVTPLIDGVETANSSATYTLSENAPTGYINIPVDLPVGGTTPDNVSYDYSPNDASVGDVDGDGEYEIILKWDPSNSKDNSQAGCTGNVFIDCYKLNGTKLWRIDLGKNIRAGAHYTQFMVYDLDLDGKAEVVMKTADGTIDGTGTFIGDASADYRTLTPANGYTRIGMILAGPEYLTVFNGQTGAAMKTIDYKPARGATNATEMKSMWGDDYGNRVDRFLACIAYLDGIHPSVVMCRGYYTRSVLVAYDWQNGELTEKWNFDSKDYGNSGYAGQGYHSLRVGDVDGDGKDEIVYGSCTIDDNGKGLYTTGLGHGDALHMTVFDPADGGLQLWSCHENKVDGSTFRDTKTGNIIFQVKSTDDVGRCMAADIDPNHKGVEMWSSRSGGIRNIKGEVVNSSTGSVSSNMAAWWDGDLLRELEDGVGVTKYNYSTGGKTTLLNASECSSNNSTKATPCLAADILGDWREEVLLRTLDNKALRLYVSTEETNYRFHTFLEDPVYRISVATQNVAYNQPTQPGFYFGADLGKCFTEKTIVGKENAVTLDAGMNYDSYQWMANGKVIGSSRTINLTANELPLNTQTTVTLDVTFRGFKFEDSADVTLTSSSTAIETNQLNNQVKAFYCSPDKSIQIEFPDSYSDIEVSLISIEGKVICKQRETSGSKAIKIPASSIAKGVYMVHINFGAQNVIKKIVLM
jgi:hypothetical protein